MTIHYAKGLEFDAVVLPELSASFLRGRERTLLTHRPAPAARLEAVSVRPSGAVRALDPQGLMALSEEQERRDVREALCLLYVAMTRARHCLEMIVAPKCERGPGQLLRDLLGGGALGAPDAEGRLWAHEGSRPAWHVPRAPTPQAPEAQPALVLGRATRPRAAVRRTPSAAEGAGRLEVRALLRSPAAAARVRGLLMHRWLESIEWLEGFSASDAELAALARPLTSDQRLVRETLGLLREALARPGLRGVLARDAQAPGVELEVWRERGFARVLPGPEGRDELWTGAIDRAVIEREGGRAVRARLFDFKTDRIEAREVDGKLEHYRPQLEAYRRVLADVLGWAQAKVEAAAVFVELDLVQSV
jgi:ATP-dependent exoDNAse (exonuclease V) beta subunit